MNEKEITNLAENGNLNVLRKTYFVQAENAFINNPNYSIYDKLVYLSLQTFAGSIDNCYPSKGSLAKNLNLSVKTIERTLFSLEKNDGILIINRIKESGRKTSNLYILADIDKYTGNFIPESLDQFRILKKRTITVRGK